MALREDLPADLRVQILQMLDECDALHESVPAGSSHIEARAITDDCYWVIQGIYDDYKEKVFAEGRTEVQASESSVAISFLGLFAAAIII